MAIWATWPALFVSSLALLGQLPFTVSQNAGFSDHIARGHVGRQLKAAMPAEKLAKRQSNVAFQNELELNYIEGEGDAQLRPLAASVIFEMKLPSLLLEGVESMIDEIHCEPGSMDLTFRSASHMSTFRDAFGTHTEFMVVTSHASCNIENSRELYLARSSSYSNDLKRITLSTERLAWKDAMSEMSTSWDRNSLYHLRSSQYLQRRRGAETPLKRGISDLFGAATITKVAVSTTTQGTLTSLSFPTPPLTPSPSATCVSDHFDAMILGQDLPLAQSGGSDMPPTIACTNCNVGGTFQMSSGSMTVGQNATQNETDGVVQFLQHGYAQIIANRFSAHVELNASWPPSNASREFSVELATIPLSPYTIPGIGVIGPFFKPKLVFSASLLSPLSFQYGFEVSIPDNTLMQVSVGNITSSFIRGIENTNFTMLPFNAQTPDLTFSVSTTFQPIILLGFSFFEGIGLAGAGVFMNLPTLTLNISQVSGVDASCNPVTSGAVSGNLTRVEPQVQITGGFLAEAELRTEIRKLKKQTSYNVFEKNFTAATQCLQFDRSKGSYAPASIAQSVGATGAMGRMAWS